MPDIDELRKAGLNAHLGHIREKLSFIHVHVQQAADIERFSMMLAGVTEPHRMEAVFDEVKRRESIFSEAKKSSMSGHPSGDPRANALRSVLDDVTSGRFG